MDATVTIACRMAGQHSARASSQPRRMRDATARKRSKCARVRTTPWRPGCRWWARMRRLDRCAWFAECSTPRIRRGRAGPGTCSCTGRRRTPTRRVVAPNDDRRDRRCDVWSSNRGGAISSALVARGKSSGALGRRRARGGRARRGRRMHSRRRRAARSVERPHASRTVSTVCGVTALVQPVRRHCRSNALTSVRTHRGSITGPTHLAAAALHCAIVAPSRRAGRRGCSRSARCC